MPQSLAITFEIDAHDFDSRKPWVLGCRWLVCMGRSGIVSAHELSVCVREILYHELYHELRVLRSPNIALNALFLRDHKKISTHISNTSRLAGLEILVMQC